MKKVNEIVADTMEANLNNSVLIKVRDAWCYHLKTEKRIILPNDPTHPIVRQRIMVLLPELYDRYFNCSVDDQIGYLKAMALSNVELVHDPEQNTMELNEEIKRFQPKPSLEQKLREGRRKATISDLEKLK